MSNETTMPFGKHKDKPLSGIPHGYLKWVLRECNLRDDLRADIQAVLSGNPVPKSMDERISDMFGGK